MTIYDEQKFAELTKQCPEGCKCRETDVENLCLARDIGLKTFVECLEEKPFECECAISYGTVSYCSCPARVHIAKSLNQAEDSLRPGGAI